MEDDDENDHFHPAAGCGIGGCSPAVAPSPTPILTQALEPTPDVQRLGGEIDALMQKNYQEGVFDGSILVAQNGQVILSKGYGYADRYKKIPITAQTKFRLGSITKQFTALAVLMLQAQGKLNVQDKLGESFTAGGAQRHVHLSGDDPF